jgi:hypothetical protein
MITLSTIIVAFLSALLGAALKLGLETWNRINEGRSTAAILAAEIAATLSIIKQRRYVEIVQGQIAELAADRNTDLVDFVRNPDTLDIAYKAAVSGFKLGLVGPELAWLVTKFYRQFYGLIGDVKGFGGTVLPPAKKIYLEEALRIWANAEREGEKAVEGLNAFALRGPLRHMWHGALRSFAR